MCPPLVFPLTSNHNLHRPPPLQPTPSTPHRACSLPRSCLLRSILRPCHQVGLVFCLNTPVLQGERKDFRGRGEEKQTLLLGGGGAGVEKKRMEWSRIEMQIQGGGGFGCVLNLKSTITSLHQMLLIYLRLPRQLWWSEEESNKAHRDDWSEDSVVCTRHE